jgi:NCS1 family nucleobase:cation symporter-1
MITTKTTELMRGFSHLERRAVVHIPETERHGSLRDQFTVWFGANSTALSMVFGSIAISLGLNFTWALVTIVLGTVLGSIVAALHAVQGPRLGLPQLLQGRGQFGYYGAVPFYIIVQLVEFGFLAAQLVTQGFLLNQLAPSVGVAPWIAICAIIPFVLAIWGYDWVHAWQRLATLVLTVSFVIMAVETALYRHHITGAAASTRAPSVAIFMVSTVIFMVNIVAWTPNVSDYSRYLPVDTRPRAVFWRVFWGNVLPTVLFAALGAYLTALLPTRSLYASIQHVLGDWALVILALSMMGEDTFNIYTGMLGLLSIGDTWYQVKQTVNVVRLRALGIIAVTVGGVLIGIAGYTTFLTSFENFLDVIVFVWFPWSAINLVDFYLIRHGQYNVREMFKSRGEYGRLRVRSYVAYLVGIGVELLFMNQTFFVGPLLKDVGGVDISWILGLFVPAVVYFVIAERRVGGDSDVAEDVPLGVELG